MSKINYVLEGEYKNGKINGYKELSVQTSEYIGGRSINKKISPPTPLLMKLTKSNIPFGRVLWEQHYLVI